MAEKQLINDYIKHHPAVEPTPTSEYCYKDPTKCKKKHSVNVSDAHSGGTVLILLLLGCLTMRFEVLMGTSLIN